jgi:2-dehydropantoate 2-reductase
MRPYVIYGAGAVGSALAAYLARRGHPVIAVARPAHVEAIRAGGGIRVISRDETFLAPVEAATGLPAELPAEAVLFLTVQATGVTEAAKAIAVAARSRPVVTWQNGIRAEESAAPFCPRLFGGVVRFTATLLDPGEVRLRRPGQLIVGRHPRGRDPLAAAMVADLAAGGFTAAESPEIGADKALKLLVNLVSGPPVLMKRTGVEPALARVQVAVLEEGRRAFEAAGIRAEPASGLGQGVEELLARFRAGGSPPDTRGGIYNSTWQNLHHRRPRLENDFYHGEIVRLSRVHGLTAPVNERVLALLEEARERGLGPERMDPAAFRSRFEDLLDFEDGTVRVREPGEGGLEI